MLSNKSCIKKTVSLWPSVEHRALEQKLISLKNHGRLRRHGGRLAIVAPLATLFEQKQIGFHYSLGSKAKPSSSLEFQRGFMWGRLSEDLLKPCQSVRYSDVFRTQGWSTAEEKPRTYE